MPPLLCILTHQRQIWNDQANRQLSLKQRGLDLGNRLNQLRPVVPDIPNLLVHRPKPQHVICGRPEQRGWIVLVLTQPQWPILPLYDYPPPFLDLPDQTVRVGRDRREGPEYLAVRVVAPFIVGSGATSTF
jgi:hypothetical protein